MQGKTTPTTVFTRLIFQDAAAAVAFCQAALGAETVIPVKDRRDGKREEHVRDPFGHLWITSQGVTV
tara:strand:+ start:213 stop:413 length:201 start_codon:yes stop_codon:yes gene_type:complete